MTLMAITVIRLTQVRLTEQCKVHTDDAYLNKCMPDDWFYASIRWQLVDVEQEGDT